MTSYLPVDDDTYSFSNHPSTTHIYTLSLHDALPISLWDEKGRARLDQHSTVSAPMAERRARRRRLRRAIAQPQSGIRRRSEEHTSELQSLAYLVCRLLLEKKKFYKIH